MRTYKEIKLQDWARYVATDKDGKTYQYDREPYKEIHEGVWRKRNFINHRMQVVIDTGVLCEDWEDSLVELPLNY